MKKWRLAAVALLVGTVAACSDDPVAPGAQPSAPGVAPLQTRDAARTIPDRYIVVFKRAVNDAPGLARSLVGAHGGKLHFTYRHALRGFAATLPPAALEAIRRNPNVDYVQPDGIARVVGTVQWGATWGLDRIDQRELPLNSTYTYTPTGAGVNVYVIDTGIATGHPEFGGRATNVFDAYGGNGNDCHGHGTHVAGTVGGATYGVAKSVSLYGVRVLDCYGSGTWSGVIAGVDWVTYHHAKPAVANMSLGGYTDYATDQAVRNSIAAGVTYTLAAGNESTDACTRSPAGVREGITVGATDRYDARAYFSNYGDCLDLFAPGVDIMSAYVDPTPPPPDPCYPLEAQQQRPIDPCYVQSAGGGTAGYGSTTMSGTSMAAPHVAGVAALYLQGDPGASPQRVRDQIMYNSTVWAVQNAGPASPPHLLYSWTGSRQRVGFRTYDGVHYLQAVNTGGAGVNATPAWLDAWERFWIHDLNGGTLNAGDPVNIKTGNEEFFLAAYGGGGAGSYVDAVQRYAHTWERFTIEKLGGGTGPITNGDQIHLRAYNPYYVVAEGAGGGAVNADRPWSSTWETFTLVFQ
jgi:subtilisin family serine protease